MIYKNPDGSVSGGVVSEEGTKVAFNLAAGSTQINNSGPGRVFNASIITAPTTASSINDCAAVGLIAASNQLAGIPANPAVGTVYKINMPYAAGLAVSIGTGGVVAISYL